MNSEGEREIVLSLTRDEYERLGRDVVALREAGVESNTAAILRACQREAARIREGE